MSKHLVLILALLAIVTVGIYSSYLYQPIIQQAQENAIRKERRSIEIASSEQYKKRMEREIREADRKGTYAGMDRKQMIGEIHYKVDLEISRERTMMIKELRKKYNLSN
ncbi:MAG: hypothetical protein OHK0029_41490 [Armatimonadaceae bacterium]